MSACLRGDINETLAADRYEDARRLAYEYQDMFGKGNFFLEIQDHGLDQDTQRPPADPPARRSDTGIPLVATNDSHYLRQDDARAHEILLCIQTGKTMSRRQPHALHATRTSTSRARAEMIALFGDVEDALDRTWDIAQRCQVKLDKVEDPFPKFDVPAGHTTDTYFDYVARQGFEKRRAAPGGACSAAGPPQARPRRVRRAARPRNPA